MRRTLLPWALVALPFCWPANAAEVTRVVSGSQAPGKLVDFNLSAAFRREQTTGKILREYEDANTAGRTILVRDLTFDQTRNILDLRAEVGVFRDLAVFVSAPLVLSDESSLSFDRSASECSRLATGVGTPSCVSSATSSTLRDGVLPAQTTGGKTSYGVDAQNGRAFETPSEMLFRGPVRAGLESLGLGLQAALMKQERDSADPTWLVSFEARLSVAADRGYDAANPKSNTAVGLGYHQFIASTVFSKRIARFEPYLGAHYMLPTATSGGAFDKYRLGTMGFGGPQHRAGMQAGTELTIYDRSNQRITLELRGRFDLRFFGLAQTPLTEPSSGSSNCPKDPSACRAGIDRDQTGDGITDPNNGVVRSPSYGVFGGDAGLNVRAGRYARFRGLVGIERQQDHFLSDGRSGNTTIDVPGRRFRIEEAQTFQVYFEGGLTF